MNESSVGEDGNGRDCLLFLDFDVRIARRKRASRLTHGP